MGFQRHLIHDCTIDTFSFSQDALGGITKAVSSSQTDVSCRLIVTGQFEPVSYMGQMVQTDAKLLLPLLTGTVAVSIATADEIKNIVLSSDDSSVDAGPFEVTSIMTRNRREKHHRAVTLKKVV